jgi:manganese transport protein
MEIEMSSQRGAALNIPALQEVYRSVNVPRGPGFFRRFLAFSGPAYLISVGYMDPGNWATDIEGGARFAYRLLWVILASNLLAIFFQTLAARLGLVTGRSLAQACRDYFQPPVALALWILCEIAIIACDLAEVLGSAIALNLLFHIPLLSAVLLTTLDVLILLGLLSFGMRVVEAFILTLITTIAGCYVVEMFLAKPDWGLSVRAFASPSLPPGSLYLALGILGATVMPHNLYLHSSLVQSRDVDGSPASLRSALRFNLIDTVIALNGAFFVNAAILIMSAAVFFKAGHVVQEIQEAHQALAPLLGTSLGSTVFAVALLCSGQSSALTGTLAGQVVMEGFLNIHIVPWLRRLVTRSLALIPAVAVVVIRGGRGTYELLIFSQVILSMQLSFAIIPLIMFTSDRRKMREFVNPAWARLLAWTLAVAIAALNVLLFYRQAPPVWLALGIALLLLFTLVVNAPKLGAWTARRWAPLSLVPHWVHEDLRAASLLQRHLLHRPLPELEAAVELRFARGVGGDFYDLRRVDRRLSLCVADVSGKGAKAALISATLRGLLDETAEQLIDPAAFLRHLNARFYDTLPEEMFITMFYGHLDLDDGELLYASAGHDPPLLCRNGSVEKLLPTAAALAIVPDLTVQTERTALWPGETLLLYTDGLTTARYLLGGRVGEERVAARLRQQAGQPPAQLLRELLELACPEAQTRLEDDVVLIALRRLPEDRRRSL